MITFFSSLFFSPSSDSLQEEEEEESRPPADWLMLGGVGWQAGGRERGRAVKCYRNSWLKRGNGRYRTSSIDTDRVGARLNCSSSRLDYGHRVVTLLPLLPQCGEATAIYGENMPFVQRYMVMVYAHFPITGTSNYKTNKLEQWNNCHDFMKINHRPKYILLDKRSPISCIVWPTSLTAQV